MPVDNAIIVGYMVGQVITYFVGLVDAETALEVIAALWVILLLGNLLHGR